jgi:crotonobetainyl-CoA:carnitine CoA-transferase CaiB-like acyl-CoA transferase
VTEILSGLRVLDFCWIGAGALVTQTLALHGAEVIKIESRQRPDGLRLSPPYRKGTSGLDASGYFASRNAGKRSFALNMTHPEAASLALRLMESCSVLTSNFRPGVMEGWGLGYDQLSASRSDLIWLSMPMQGEEGPNRGYVGFGSTIAALSGLVAPSGLPGRTPIGTGTHYPDHIPNPGHALVALLAALVHRNRTGRGGRIELSQFESTVNMVGPAIVAESVTGADPQPTGNRADHRCPHGVYPCAGDDRWLAVSVADDADWVALTDELGLTTLATDRSLMTLAGRKEHESLIDEQIAAVTVHFGARDLMMRLQARNIAASEVESVRDVLTDPVLADRQYWRVLDHPVMGPIRVASGPFVWSGSDVAPKSPAPLLGQDTETLARGLLGMTDAEIERLMADKVLW